MKMLDSSALIELMKGSEKGDKVKEIVKSERVYMSAISLAEVAVWLHKNNREVNLLIEKIKKNAAIIELENSLLVESGKLNVELRKKRKSISLIDTIIYFSAVVNDLTLVTTDYDFHNLQNVEMY